jgi:hypothetical protein
MKLSSQRGHLMLLVMVALVAFLVGSMLFARSINSRIDGRRASGVRIQATTLARSALDAGVTGRTTIQTPHGTATVQASPGRAVVELEGARAEANSNPHTERFEPAR